MSESSVRTSKLFLEILFWLSLGMIIVPVFVLPNVYDNLEESPFYRFFLRPPVALTYVVIFLGVAIICGYSARGLKTDEK